jgi:hypothetical protein
MVVYLYSLYGYPQYVGQTSADHLEKRHQDHCTGSLVFDQFLMEIGPEKFTLKIVANCEDWPHGVTINLLENEAMELYGTYYPETGYGWNFSRACFTIGSEEKYWQARAASEIAKKLPEVRIRHRKATIAASTTPEARKRNSEAKKKNWSDPQYRGKMVAVQTAAANRPENKQRNSEILRAWQKNPEMIAIRTAAIRQPHVREKNGASQRARWANPEIRAAIIEAQNLGRFLKTVAWG